MADEVDRVSGGRRFPVIVIDGDVIVGFKPEEFEQRMNRDSVAGED